MSTKSTQGKTSIILLILVALLIIAGVAYWYFFMQEAGTDVNNDSQNVSSDGFVPFGRKTPPITSGDRATNTASSTVSKSTPGTQLKVPSLRLLSDVPVGGYGASTTGPVNARPASTTTVFRWVERGRGNVLETTAKTNDVTTLSNTVVPKIVESGWNKNLTGFLALTLSDDGDSVVGIAAQLKKRLISSSTPDSQTKYELKGKVIPDTILSYAVSPKKDRVFIFVNENGYGVGYTMNFDGTLPVRIFSTPITQAVVEWPTDNTIALTTKGGSDSAGFLYFIDSKTGVWRKILGPLPGLGTKVSTDGKKVFLSVSGSSDNVVSSIYDVAKKSGTGAVVRTLADKCVWGNFYKDMVYCAVPSQPVSGTYPDDWYKGKISFVDKIWQVNAVTGEVHLISSIIDTSDRIIDAFNLGLDEKDNFLIFMNKNDLSLWSLDLVAK